MTVLASRTHTDTYTTEDHAKLLEEAREAGDLTKYTHGNNWIRVDESDLLKRLADNPLKDSDSVLDLIYDMTEESIRDDYDRFREEHRQAFSLMPEEFAEEIQDAFYETTDPQETFFGQFCPHGNRTLFLHPSLMREINFDGNYPHMDTIRKDDNYRWFRRKVKQLVTPYKDGSDPFTTIIENSGCAYDGNYGFVGILADPLQMMRDLMAGKKTMAGIPIVGLWNWSHGCGYPEKGNRLVRMPIADAYPEKERYTYDIASSCGLVGWSNQVWDIKK